MRPLIAVVCLALLAGCTFTDATAPNAKRGGRAVVAAVCEAPIVLSPSAVTLAVGESATLHATLCDAAGAEYSRFAWVFYGAEPWPQWYDALAILPQPGLRSVVVTATAPGSYTLTAQVDESFGGWGWPIAAGTAVVTVTP